MRDTSPPEEPDVIAADAGGDDAESRDGGRSDAVDVQETSSDTDRRDGADAVGGDDAGDGGFEDDTCNYRGQTKGVCAGAELTTPGESDVGLEPGDVGLDRRETGICQRPDAYASPTDDESCDGLDNDCDGAVDEGCGCIYDPSDPDKVDDDQSNTSGVCINQVRGPDGVCQIPDNFDDTDDESSVGDGELCDGVDNDCDGVVDEGCGCTYDPEEPKSVDRDDSNASGVCPGQTRDEQGVCQTPADYDSTDDESAADLCDGIDNDCDGAIDEGCGCIYDPEEANNIDTDDSNDVGICPGQTRDASGDCRAPNLYDSTDDEAAANLCGDNKDNDCDGTINEGCSCNFQGLSEGVCGDSTIDPNTGQCAEPTDYDTTDDESSVSGLCDGQDNDCDGAVDEGCSCDYQNISRGVCTGQTRDGQGNCQQPSSYQSPTADETCDDKDNDCDGAVDEGCDCTYDPDESSAIDTDDSNDAGVCPGQTIASNGTCSEPSGYDGTDNEDTAGRCDGLDNDCDGVTDEGCSCDYDGSSLGVCSNGTISSSDGSCTAPSNYDSTDDEEGANNCDGVDNDCDGVTDEGCSCDYDNTSTGVCSNGTISSSDGSCDAPSSYDSTDDEKSAGNCDGVDNDCDGVTDEGCSCNYDNTSTGVCSNGTLDNQGKCQPPSDYESDENSCDGLDNLDNDCDGTVDEGCPGLSCQGFRMCMDYCSRGDNQCRQSAINVLSPTGGQSLKNLTQCAQNNCPNAGESCLQTNCKQEYDACYGPPNGTDYTCGEAIRCLNDCPTNDQQCAQDCEQNTLSSEWQKFQRYSLCIRRNCGQNPDENCIETNCKSQETACFRCPDSL